MFPITEQDKLSSVLNCKARSVFAVPCHISTHTKKMMFKVKVSLNKFEGNWQHFVDVQPKGRKTISSTQSNFESSFR